MPSRTRRSLPGPVRLETGATTVVFEWTGDRWGHRVLVGGVVVAESVEHADRDSRADPRWPASPAIVELTAGGEPAAHVLGVGAAGRSHFSLVVTPHATAVDTARLEVACRVVETPGWLGSTYRRPESDGGMAVISPLWEPGTGPLPRTIRWSYQIGPDGIRPHDDAALGEAG